MKSWWLSGWMVLKVSETFVTFRINGLESKWNVCDFQDEMFVEIVGGFWHSVLILSSAMEWYSTVLCCFVCCVSGRGVIQYSIVLFCVPCFRPWSATVQYCVVLCAVFQAMEWYSTVLCCFVCCVSGYEVIQYCIVLCAVFQAVDWYSTVLCCFVCCVSGCGVLQYSIILFCVLCFRPWSDAVQYCVVLCAVFQAMEWYSAVLLYSLCAAFQAIKTDVVRSLCTRCDLLSEDLELTDEISGEVISVCHCWSRDICHQVDLCAVIWHHWTRLM